MSLSTCSGFPVCAGRSWGSDIRSAQARSFSAPLEVSSGTQPARVRPDTGCRDRGVHAPGRMRWASAVSPNAPGFE